MRETERPKRQGVEQFTSVRACVRACVRAHDVCRLSEIYVNPTTQLLFHSLPAKEEMAWVLSYTTSNQTLSWATHPYVSDDWWSFWGAKLKLTQLWCQRKRNIIINEWAGVLRLQFRLDTQLYSSFTLAAFWSSKLEGDHRSKSLLLLDWLRPPATGSQLQHWSAMVYFSWTFCVLSLIESLNRIDFFRVT